MLCYTIVLCPHCNLKPSVHLKLVLVCSILKGNYFVFYSNNDYCQLSSMIKLR